MTIVAALARGEHEHDRDRFNHRQRDELMTAADSVMLANPMTCDLGEGPVWDPIRETVLWIDVTSGVVYSGRLDDHGRVPLHGRTTFPGTVGAVAVAEDGSWIVAGSHSLILHPVSGEARELARIIPYGQSRRTNDGKPDPTGRFLIGTLSLHEESECEVLVRLDAEGTLTTIDHDLTLSNGLAWSPDGSIMYSVDTSRRVVFARSYDTETGAIGERRTFIEVEEGFPDGMCSDEDGHLWIAMWGLGEVRRYKPDGQLDRAIQVPAPHVSSVAFVGTDLDTLVITTATQDLTEQQLAEYPLSGKLFTARPGVRGTRVPLWSGLSEIMKENT